MSGRRKTTGACAALLGLTSLCALAEPPEPRGGATRIHHLESLRDMKRSAAVDAVHERLSFEAFGRRFELELEPNTRIAAGLAPDHPARPLAGRVMGEARSWVRLTRLSAGWQGMLYDGRDHYAIEPAVEARRIAMDPAAPATGSVMFRLADLEVDPAAMRCGTVHIGRQTTALDALEAVQEELVAAAATVPTRQINVGAVGDFEFFQRQGSVSAAESYMAARLNVVDGIFSSQLALRVAMRTAQVFTSSNDPFTRSDAADLLEEVEQYRFGSPSERASGLTHLFTGRTLDGSTVGIAYIGGACTSCNSGSFCPAVGLTETRFIDSTSASLVAAHEIGHNFNAPHDGDAAEACASTPAGLFLMSSSLPQSGTLTRNQLSQCSTDVINAYIASRGSCLVSPDLADLELVSPVTNTRHGLDENFSLQLTVRSIGNRTANDASVSFTIPTGIELASIAAAGATCVSGAGVANCDFSAALDSGVTRSITLSLTGRTLGSGVLRGTVRASNDANAGNDGVSVTVRTDPVIDLAATLAASPTSLDVGASLTATAGVRNLSDRVAADVRLSLDVPGGITVNSTNGGSLACTTATSSVSCGPFSLDAGASLTVAVSLTASQGGTRTLTALALSSAIDPVTGNDSASVAITVTGGATTAQPPASDSSGGGGGRLSPLLLLGLAWLLVFSLVRRATRR